MVKTGGFKLGRKSDKPMVPKVTKQVAATQVKPYLATTADVPAVAVKLAFECKLCGMSFDRAQKLGGHCSRLHPGQNDKYNKKIERRNEREHIRESLRQAKLVVKRADFTSESEYLKGLKRERKRLEQEP